MKLYLIILLILLAGMVSGRSRSSFEHFSVEDGLANNSVRAIFQDREGFLWFGTLNGLCRYDGQQFRTFAFDPGNPASISDNKIRSITQDGAGYLWITTYNNHVHRFDSRTETFVNFPGALGERFATCQVRFIRESSPGVNWLVLSGQGCVRVISSPGSPDFRTDWFREGKELPAADINFIYPGEGGRLWIGTDQGLVCMENDRIYPGKPETLRMFLPACGVVSMLETDRGVWIGCRDGSIFRLTGNQLIRVREKSKTRNQDRRITFLVSLPGQRICAGSSEGLLLIHEETGRLSCLNSRNSNLLSDRLLSCYPDRYGDLWLVTGLRGVIRFQPESDRFIHYPLHPEIRQTIQEGEKQVFREDCNGKLWIGIYGGGLSCFNRETGQFEQFLYEADNPGSLSSNLVLSLFEDRSGNLWAGTYKRGLNRISLQQDNFRFAGERKRKRDYNNEVRALFCDSKNRIWTGNKRGELVVYDRDMNLLFTGNDLPGLGPETLAAGIYAFEEDRDRNLWIGTKGNGIFVLKELQVLDEGPPFSGILNTEHFFSGNGLPGRLTHDDVFDLHEDRFGQMWVALYHGGINVIRNPFRKDRQILQYRHNEEDRFSLVDNRVRCLLEDFRGNMWIGTANGLSFLPADYVPAPGKKFSSCVRSDTPGSLSNNDIISIAQDSKDNIWICTYGGGLNRLSPESREPPFAFFPFTDKEGLPGNLVLGVVEDLRNNLWISTDFGLSKFRPEDQSVENFYEADGLPENSFSESSGILTPCGKVVFGDLSGMIWFEPDSIRKSHKPVPVVLTDLLVSGQPDPGLLQEARSLLGDTLRTLQLKHNENFLSFQFAALDFGSPSKIRYRYKLEPYEENWNLAGKLNQALYRELAPGDYLFRLRATNSDGLWVNPELKLGLTVAPPPWRTGWACLFYLLVAGALFLLVRRILLERIRLKHEVEYAKRLSEEKLRFYTSISHEFKTPLALIIGPVEDLLASADLSPLLQKPLLMIRRNACRLLELIEQLMDFRKIQKGFFRVHPATGDLVNFLNEIYRLFLPLAEKQQICFDFSTALPELVTTTDFKLLEKIVFNLLSNAFKHTPAGKKISLLLSANHGNARYQIAVKDEGEGIPEADMMCLFERFSLSNASRWKEESGTGVGLSLARELTGLLEGSIDVSSTPGQGSCFTVDFPVCREPASAQPETHPETAYTRKYTLREASMSALNPETRKKNPAKRETVLVVEDHPELSDNLAEQLSDKYRELQAVNG
ncbi:MAG: two-component regulator propeller domain-containing protein, partial [Mangrovibacterium sp.]